jgi:AbrB family looped-hinge helix DNA binding protein
MPYSTVTNKGQTTIPGEIRKALDIKPGDKLEYTAEGDHVIFHVHPGARSLLGVLSGDEGKNLTFAQIRRAAAENSRRKRKQR